MMMDPVPATSPQNTPIARHGRRSFPAWRTVVQGRPRGGIHGVTKRQFIQNLIAVVTLLTYFWIRQQKNTETSVNSYPQLISIADFEAKSDSDYDIC